MKKTLGIMLVMGFACAANAGIVIYGSSTGYQNNDKDWLSHTTDDIDGNGLGTDGYIFFGYFGETTPNNNTNPGNDQNENIFGANQLSTDLITVSQPSYIPTAATGANSGNIGRYGGYEAIDSPILGDGTDRVAGNLLVTGATGPGEALEFTVSGLAAGTTIRVGLFTVLNDDTRARFDIPTVGLTDGTDTLYVTDLPNLSSSADTTGPGWVFFDIDSDGDYTVLVPPDAAGIDPDVTGLGGVTFDSIFDPGAGAALVLSPGSLSLDLVAPDTSTNGTITASYVAGATSSNDITIVSALADAGFTAMVANSIGLANPNEDSTVTFDNSGIGLANGESTNSTLEVIWTEDGSGVVNTSSVPLDVTYINEPSSLDELAPATLSLTLHAHAPDTSTNGTIVASFVAGTLSTDVEIVSVVATNGFSALPSSFVLGTGNTNEVITVTYTNTGALVNHEDTASSTLVVTWTEVGSGVTNTANADLEVTYFAAFEIVTFHSDFDEASLAAITGLNIDTPNTDLGTTDSGTVALNTVNDQLDLAANGANLWLARDGAPIAWVAAPTVASGETWFVETQVNMVNGPEGDATTYQQGGITFYGGPDGANPGDIDASALVLSDWNGWVVQNAVLTEGSQVANGDALTATDTSIFLRTEITEGGVTDTYNCFYKENAGDPWSQIGGLGLNRTNSASNSRVALFLKSHNSNTNAAAQFDYFTVGVLSEVAPEPFFTDIAVDGSEVILSWDAREYKLYDVEEATDLVAEDWMPIPGLTNLADLVGPVMVTTAVSSADRAYYQLLESDAPAQVAYETDFEGVTTNTTDWTWGSDGAVGTAWELGTPTSGPNAANSGTNCWGTNLAYPHAFNADVWLRTPVIDLSAAGAATLKFWHFKDIEIYSGQPDHGVVTVLDATGSTVLAELTRQDGATTAWEDQEFQIPTEALGQPVIVEFRFVCDDYVNKDGWYIDDVSVTVP